MKYVFAILPLLFACITAAAQDAYQYLKADSVRSSYFSMPDDTAKVNRMNNQAAMIMNAEPIIAKLLLQDARAVAEKINYKYGISVSLGTESRLLFYQVKFDSGKLLLDKAYNLLEKENDKNAVIQKATLIHTYANIYHQKQEYDSALIKYQKAISLFTSVNEKNKIFFSYYNISGIYHLLGDTAKAMYYAKELMQMAEASSDINYKMRSLIAYAEAFEGKKQYDSVYKYAEKGLSVIKGTNNVFGVGKFYTLLGTYHREKQKYDSSIFYFKEALDLYSSINIWYDIALVQQQLGNVFLKAGNYVNAVKYLKKADAIAVELNLYQVRLLTLPDLVEAQEKLGNIKASNSYLKTFIAVKDTVQERNNRKMVNELEAKYQTEQKEIRLREQQLIIQRKDLITYILGGTAIAILIISLLSYRTYLQKQKLQQQQIAELEKEKQLLAAEAVLQGQEEERTRLAKDLHDGLGGMLSGIKYSFNSMKGNLVLTPDNANAFERSMDMLDSSIKELRSVAHNLMPESLLKFGLDTALKDFCDSITGSGALKVSYHSFGMQKELLDKNTEITLYRIIQELVNNTIKHAAATEAIVQLQTENERLTVTVEDNGKGFDVNFLELSKGIGWANIKNRVEYLKGTVNLNSEKDKGTSITIELTI